MTLGRTSSGAIKIKTDGGTTRAVECGCCGCNDSLIVYVNGELMQKMGPDFIFPNAWFCPTDCAILTCGFKPYNELAFAKNVQEWGVSFWTPAEGYIDEWGNEVLCSSTPSCEEQWFGCGAGKAFIITEASVIPPYPTYPKLHPFQEARTPYGTFVYEEEGYTKTFVITKEP